MNRELVRLLVFMQCTSIMDRYFEYLESDAPNPEKAHLAMHMRFLTSGWTTERKIGLFKFIAEAKNWDGGSSYPLYLGNAARDMAKQLTLEESLQILPQGAELTDAALGALYKLPAQLDNEQRAMLQQFDDEDRPTHRFGQQAVDGRHRRRAGTQR